MTFTKLVINSIRFNRRTNACVCLSVMVAAIVLTGSLLVGDSVRYSLRRLALLRLGKTESAIYSRNRFFSGRLAEELNGDDALDATGALQLPGVVVHQEPESAWRKQVNNVQVLGVAVGFWSFADGGGEAIAPGTIALSVKVAEALDAVVGDEVSVRLMRPGLMPEEAPLSFRRDRTSVQVLLEISRIVQDDELGRFSLSANQIAPYNVFVDLGWLQKIIGLEDKINLLLAKGASDAETSCSDAQRILERVWEPDDVGMRMESSASKRIVQLESERIFLQRETAAAALKTPGTVGALTYLVNDIRKKNGDVGTPYSFVTAIQPTSGCRLGIVPADMRDDQIIINEWVARELDARAGDSLDLKYYELTDGNEFIERTRTFAVHSIVKMASLGIEKELVPRFPGLADVERCASWDVSMPMDDELLNDEKNEQYWGKYRATPKAFVTLVAGQEMWANRFGNLSGVRIESDDGAELTCSLKKKLSASSLGLFFVPVNQEAKAAVRQGMDFGQLFASMSFFLITAALLLSGMVFVFAVEQRSEHIGTLLALGFTRGQTRKVFLLEGCIVACMGAILGALLGILYTRLLIWGLTNHWQGAIAGSTIQYHVAPGTVLAGGIVTAICAMLVMRVVMAKRMLMSVAGLLRNDAALAPATNRSKLPLPISITTAMLAAGLVVWADVTDARDTAFIFFGAGALLLVAGIAFLAYVLGRISMRGGTGRLSFHGLAVRTATRRRGRSLVIAALLASGCFMVFAVLAMKEDVTLHAGEGSSGTGGFDLFGETTAALLEDAGGNSPIRSRSELPKLDIVLIKMRSGDDAGCLNLNRAQSPKLLGIDPTDMISRGSFVSANEEVNPWSLLEEVRADGAIPALAGDGNTAMWGLQMKVGPIDGDALIYRDETGKQVLIKLVGKLPMKLSVFQGSILISRSHFNRLYPSDGGYRVMLVDGAGDDSDRIAAELSADFARVGLDLVPATQRLEEFYAVESTYLSIFLLLGGLGLLLGTVGTAAVVLRNILERRCEIAVLRCIGYSRSAVCRLVIAEHWFLIAYGLLLGVAAACTALWPSFTSAGTKVPYGLMLVMFAGIAATGFLLTAVAALAGMRRSLVTALRDE